MKVSKALKIAAVIMLLHSLLYFWGAIAASGLGWDPITGSPATGSPVNMLVCLVYGIAELVIAIGLLRAKKMAVYAAPIFSTIIFFMSLTAVFSISAQHRGDVLNPVLVIFYAIVIWLSISCIIKNRQQSKIS